MNESPAPTVSMTRSATAGSRVASPVAVVR